MSYLDPYSDPEARKQYLREYMRKWRRRNPEKQKKIQDKQNEAYRLKQLECVCAGDGFDVDETNLLPETPRQARMWKELLAAAR